MKFLDDATKHHKLVIIAEPREPRLPEEFLAFACTDCKVEFYILGSDLVDHLIGKKTTPMKSDGKMFYRSGGEWQLIYTLIS